MIIRHPHGGSLDTLTQGACNLPRSALGQSCASLTTDRVPFGIFKFDSPFGTFAFHVSFASRIVRYWDLPVIVIIIYSGFWNDERWAMTLVRTDNDGAVDLIWVEQRSFSAIPRLGGKDLPSPRTTFRRHLPLLIEACEEVPPFFLARWKVPTLTLSALEGSALKRIPPSSQRSGHVGRVTARLSSGPRSQ